MPPLRFATGQVRGMDGLRAAPPLTARIGPLPGAVSDDRPSTGRRMGRACPIVNRVPNLKTKSKMSNSYIPSRTEKFYIFEQFLTGQVVAKVVNLANDLETQLVKLLVQAAPPEQAHKVEAALTHNQDAGAGEPRLDGPVVNAEGRTDVVANQSEVDDLLASLGF